MKPSFFAVGLLVLAFILAGCTSSPSSATPAPSIAGTASPAVSVAAVQCRSDADCVVSGCSGQVCQSKTTEPAVTTCEYTDEYACYKPEGCLCQEGSCAWSDSTVQCIREANQPDRKIEAEFKCVQTCRELRAYGTDLSSGPCLSNAVAPGWVCDVAHWPRQTVDDVEENTCPAFGQTAQHFVEVDPDCNLIQIV